MDQILYFHSVIARNKGKVQKHHLPGQLPIRQFKQDQINNETITGSPISIRGY